MAASRGSLGTEPRFTNQLRDSREDHSFVFAVVGKSVALSVDPGRLLG